MSAGTAANVTTGKRRIDGGIYIAPAGTALPTDASATLANTFVNVGYISEDGVSNKLTRTKQEIKEWNGDIVDSSITEFKDEWKIKFIEALNTDVLKLVFGSTNVTTTNNKIKVNINSKELEEHVIVIDMALKGGKLKRIVIPRGKVTEIGDIVYKASEAVAYDTTIGAYPDGSGNPQYEYIDPAPAA